jgi:hypothetical protein
MMAEISFEMSLWLFCRTTLRAGEGRGRGGGGRVRE